MWVHTETEESFVVPAKRRTIRLNVWVSPHNVQVMNGVMLNKDVTMSKMRRRIEKPRILLMDMGLEFKKGESQTNIELSNETDCRCCCRREVPSRILCGLAEERTHYTHTTHTNAEGLVSHITILLSAAVWAQPTWIVRRVKTNIPPPPS